MLPHGGDSTDMTDTDTDTDTDTRVMYVLGLYSMKVD